MAGNLALEVRDTKAIKPILNKILCAMESSRGVAETRASEIIENR